MASESDAAVAGCVALLLVFIVGVVIGVGLKGWLLVWIQ